MAKKKKNSLVFIVMDACRYDSFMDAKPDPKSPWGKPEKRYTGNNWTVSSVASLLTGMLPFKLYKGQRDQHRTLTMDSDVWREMTGCKLEYGVTIWMPFLLQQEGYYTLMLSSISLVNTRSIFRMNFDNCFYNKGATLERKIQIMQTLTGCGEGSPEKRSKFFSYIHTHETKWPFGDPELNKKTRNKNEQERQVQQIKDYIFPGLEYLMTTLDPGTWVIITADHAECFGDDGLFGHGHQIHPKTYEVPFVRFQV